MKMRTAVILMFVVLFGSFALSVKAAGPEVIPVSGTIANPCGPGSFSYTGEFTILDHGKGSHDMSLVRFTASGDDSSGNHFVTNQTFLADFNNTSGSEATEQINIEIEGKDIHFTESASLHITITPDGQLVHEIDSSVFTCH
jgi:hypothetical protein